MERSKAFEVAAEELNRFRGQLLGIIAEAVIQQSAPDHVVGDSPDRSKPRRGVPRGTQVVHFLHAREGPDAKRRVECFRVAILFNHNPFGLLRGGKPGPEREEPRPDANPLDYTRPVSGHSLVKAECALSFYGKQIQI